MSAVDEAPFLKAGLGFLTLLSPFGEGRQFLRVTREPVGHEGRAKAPYLPYLDP